MTSPRGEQQTSPRGHDLDFVALLRLRDDEAARLRLLGEVGYLALYLGDLQAADEVFTAVTVVAAEEPVGHLGLAEVALSRGRPEEAERRATQAACCRYVDGDKAAWANTLRARALREMQRDVEAAQAVAAVDELAPDGAAAAALRLRQEIEAMQTECAEARVAGDRARGEGEGR